MKAHVNFTITSDLSRQVIPEADELSSNGSTSDSDSSSDERDEGEHERDGSFNYPPDLLGMSWGSYLHSGPPTRSGHNPLISGHQHHQSSKTGGVKRVMLQNAAIPQQFENPVPDSTDQLPSARPRPLSDEKEPAAGSGLSPHVRANEPHPLFPKLDHLLRSLSTSKKELSKCGVETTPLLSLSDAAHSSHYDLKQLVAQLGDKKDQCGPEILSSGVLHSVIDYLGAVLDGLVTQGKKLSEQAAFLQKTGKQLGRNQQNFLREQKEIQQAIENARGQLLQEKEELEDHRESLHNAEQELRRFHQCEQDLSRHREHHRMRSPHSIAQGQRQMEALGRTQKEQSRLEKLLLQQQREMRNLQREQNMTKSELLITQEHATKLHRKLTIQSHKADTASLKPLLSDPRAVRRKKGQRSTENTAGLIPSALQGLSSTQQALHQQIDRIRQQLAEQQRRERVVQEQLLTSSRKLGSTGTRLKHQTAAIRGGHHYHEYTHKQTTSSPYHRLPRVRQNKPTEKKSKPSHVTESYTLPKLVETHPGMLTVAARRDNSQAAFCFSRKELQGLACFKDSETADQVIEWLEQQGKLTDL